ncbi:MAG TPA: DUF1289 domain-containing protein [Gammaproteobacteria bacterium]|nr:DUF1289 domain-containing protein [Gammaproteobacteria bacterium]
MIEQAADPAACSPCVNICELNAQDYCRGCARSRTEIALWGTMNADERRIVLADLPHRSVE